MEFAVLVEVRLLRRQGRKLTRREVEDGPLFKGELLATGSAGSVRPEEVHLIVPGNAQPALLPPLYDPAFSGVNADSFFLRGIERLELPEGVCGVVQEWRCRPIRSNEY